MSLGTLWLLVRRGLRASWGAAAVLAAVSLVVALVLTSLPRAVERWHGAMLGHAASQVSAVSRDLRLTPAGAPRSFTDRAPDVVAAPPWDGALTWLQEVREGMPEPLRGTVGRPHVTVSAAEVPVAPAPGLGISAVRLVPRAAPDLAEHARLVEGAWPQPSPVTFRWGDGAGEADDAAPVAPTQIVLSREGASAIGWTVGSVHELPPPFPPVEVVGVYEPVDGSAGYFEHAAYGGAPMIVTDPLSGTTVTLAGSVAPEVILPLALGSPRLTLWYPVDLSDVAGDDTRTLLDQARRFTAASLASSGLDGVAVRATTGTTALLGRVLAQQVSVDAVLAVTAAGPVGALLVVLALGSRLVVERRRQALALLHARGASGGAVRAVAGAEGAVAGLPGAVVGTALGLVLVPGPLTASQVLLALVAGLAPAAALTLTASGARLGVGRRADLGAGGRRGRWRVTGEALVLIAAALSVWFLVARGAVGAGGGAAGTPRAERLDPLVVVAPALLCLAVALLGVRALPWLVAPLERALARWRGLVGFLGAARARRDPAGGVLPAVALVLCVAVGASSSVLSTTVDAGMSDAAWEQVGADVRVSDVWISPEQVAGLRAVDGVAAVATLGGFGAGTVTPLDPASPGTSERVAVVAVDAAELARVQGAVPGAVPAAELAALTRDTAGGVLPVLASATTALADAAAGNLAREGSTRDPVPVRSVGTIDLLPGMPPAQKFVVVDAARAADVFGVTYLPGVALVRLDPGAGPTADVPPALAAVVGTDTARWETAAGTAADLARSPAPRALRLATTASLALAAALVAMTVVLTLLLAGPARARLLAVLRSLGAGARQGRYLVVWETAPWVVVALAAGAVLGWAVPAVVLAAVDLTVLTGGSVPPPARYDPAVLGGLGGAVVLVAVAAGAVVALRSGRDVAARLRTGGDG